MTDRPTVSGGRSSSAAARVGSGTTRVYRAWRALPHERRLAAYAAIGLFLAMFLPWYQQQFFVILGGKLQPAADSQTAWGAFSFVEAAVLLVAGGVLTLLFQRAEGKAFHLPGGDGGVIMVAGAWAAVLIVWRIFDKQGGQAHGQNATTYGIEWGIFVALVVAVLLTYAGSRIRAAHQPEPPLPGEKVSAEKAPGAEAPVSRRPAVAAEAATRAAPPPPRQERPVGWLTARPSAEQSDRTQPTRPAQPQRSARPPRPVEAVQPPSAPPRPAQSQRSHGEEPAFDAEATIPLPPSTPAGRRRRPPDEQLTIRIDPDD